MQGIGTYNADGTRKLPDTDIDGKGYNLPPTTIDLGNGYFAVVPIRFSDDSRVEALKAAVAKPAPISFKADVSKDDAK